MANRFIPNPAGVLEIAREPGVRAHVATVTSELRNTAQAGSPIRSGHFASSFETEVEMTSTGAVGHLGNSDAGAWAIELGSINNPPFAPMRRACRTLGLDLRNDGGGR